MSKNIKTVPTKDFEDVVATVAKYVEDLRVGSGYWPRSGIPQGRRDLRLHEWRVAWRPRSRALYDFVEKNGTAPNIKTQLNVHLGYSSSFGTK